MLSSRHSYYPDPLPQYSHQPPPRMGLEFYRRADGGLRMPLGQQQQNTSSPSLNEQYDSTSPGQLSRRTTPGSSVGGGGGGGGALGDDRGGGSAAVRKRVPVACERCRKRKIKCSGDEGGSCSSCRNAGLVACQFLRVSTIPSADQYYAIRHQEMRTRAHANQWHHHHASHNTTSMHRYSPYPMPTSSSASSASGVHHHGHYTRQQHHHQQQPSTAYNGYPSSISPTSYSPSSAAYSSEYGASPYGGGVNQAVSWTRTGSYSGYAGYDAASTGPYDTQQTQPASFLLPNTNPMGNTAGASYNALMHPYERSNSQMWADASLLTGNYAAVGAASETMAYDPVMMGASATLSGASGRGEASVPYQLITNNTDATTGLDANVSAISSDRTLPNPGSSSSRGYGSTSHPSSAQDALPLSAVSHRSSLGWSTDSASGASHASSQTSVTGSTGHEQYISPLTDRVGRAEHGVAELPYTYAPFTAATSNLRSTASHSATTDPALMTGRYTAKPSSSGGVSQSADVSSSMHLPRYTYANTDGASHYSQRCRTISESSTPGPRASQGSVSFLTGDSQSAVSGIDGGRSAAETLYPTTSTTANSNVSGGGMSSVSASSTSSYAPASSSQSYAAAGPSSRRSGLGLGLDG